jgi:hypothetical protein
MNKLVLILLLLFNFCLNAQEATSVSNLDAKPTFTSKDVIVDNDSISELHFSTNFKKKYNSNDFIYEEKTPEKNAWDRFKEWLSGLIQRLFNFSNNKVAMDVTVTILKILAVLIIGFAVYKIVKALLNKEGQWVFGKNTQKKFETDAEIEKHLKTADFEKLVQKTLSEDQKRLTLRYYYLWLLQKMSQKQLIEWDIEKTNTDYLYEIKNQEQKDRFAYLSYLYNYSWYGEFEMNQVDFDKAKLAFETTLKSLGS